MSAMDVLVELIECQTDECIEWPMSRNERGYGKIGIAGRCERTHVIACRLHHGEAPAGMEVAHSCDNPPCINPRHLRWATHADNMADLKRRGRAQRGERHFAARLTAEQVLEIRRVLHTARQAEIAARYGIARNTVSQIATRRTWAWLEDPAVIAAA